MAIRHSTPCRILLVDNFDSFTYNIYDYLCRLGAEVKVCSRNEKLFLQNPEDFDGIVISPGPGNPTKLPELHSFLESVPGRIPVVGICLGHQAIAHYFGAKIMKAEPVHGKLSRVDVVNDSPLLKGLPESFRVVRYHSLLAVDLPDCLIPLLLTSEDRALMAFAHRNLPVMGIQFHPEAHLTEFGLLLLENWLDVCVKNRGIFFSET